MTEAADAPVQHRVCLPGQWPQLSEQDRAIALELGQIGIPRNAALALMAFRQNGQDLRVTSWWLEHVTDSRQPEMSMALAWLQKEGQVKVEKQMSEGGKGRPLKVFALTRSVEGYVRLKIYEYRQQAEDRVASLTKIFPGV